MNLSFNGKRRPTQCKERRLACRRSRLLRRSSCEGWIGEGGGSRRHLKSTAGKPSFLDRSPTGYNCLVTILLPCLTKIPLPNYNEALEADSSSRATQITMKLARSTTE